MAAPLVSGCQLLPEGSRAIAPQDVRRALESTFDVAVRASPTPPEATTLANVEAIYSARIGAERLHVVVFDSSAATVQVTGADPGEVTSAARLVKRGNVVVLYSGPRGGVDREARLATVLEKLYAAAR